MYDEKMIKFVYGEPALIVQSKKEMALVIGDLHIGMELKLLSSGIRMYGESEKMANKIIELMQSFGLSTLVIAGDLKNSILYPEKSEAMYIKNFFNLLSNYKMVLVKGNHDSRINEIIDIETANEYAIGNTAIIHGHEWPSEECMSKEYLITAHNHVSISLQDSNGAIYLKKIWVVAKPNAKACKGLYPNFNAKIKQIMLPAFNEFITGSPASSLLGKGRNISPIVTNRIFDYKHALAYTLESDLIGELGSIKNSEARP
ncbi:MAG: metallophosphoesterase [Candidatus Micrarchaeaceae archaeon]